MLSDPPHLYYLKYSQQHQHNKNIKEKGKKKTKNKKKTYKNKMKKKVLCRETREHFLFPSTGESDT